MADRTDLAWPPTRRRDVLFALLFLIVGAPLGVVLFLVALVYPRLIDLIWERFG